MDCATRLFGTLTDDISGVDASRQETENRIASLRSQLATTPRQTASADPRAGARRR